MCIHDLTNERERKPVCVNGPSSTLEEVRELFLGNSWSVVLNRDGDVIGPGLASHVDEHRAACLTGLVAVRDVAKRIPHKSRDRPREFLTIDEEGRNVAECGQSEVNPRSCGLLDERPQAGRK